MEGPDEASAARVARALMDRGFSKARLLEGGLDAWMAAGLDVEEEKGEELLVALRGKKKK